VTEALKLTPSESVSIRRRSPDLLEVEGRYGPKGKPPPKHWHPAQDERFEVLEGTLNTRVDGHERELHAGDVLEIPRGTVHAMWNPGDQPAVVNWRTTPAGRTLDWFREVAAVLRGEGRPNPEDLLSDYADVYRLADG
jgi:quercetin dioxygenase-like cupin family protein